MSFVLRMAVREMRASWQRLLFFFLCVAIGVGAIAALRSVIQSVRGALAARSADADRRRRRAATGAPWTRRVRGIDRRGARRCAATCSAAKSTETADHGAPGRRAESAVARMVELRAVDAGVPVLRRASASRAASLQHALLRGPRRAGAAGAARRSSASQVGDRIVIGQRALRDSRRDRRGAGPPARRVLAGPARAHRRRRSRARPAC